MIELPKGSKVICLMRHGSHLYGLNTENSDVDYKGVFIPDLKDYALGLVKDEYRASTGAKDAKNEAGDIDVVYYSLGKFVQMLIQGETIAIDMIHCNEQNLIESSEEWFELKRNRKMFYTRNMKAFLGYVKKQAHKYGVRGSRVSSIERALEILRAVKAEGDLKPRLGCVELIDWIAELSSQDDYVQFFNEGLEDANKPLIEVAGSKYSIRTPIADVIKSLESKLKGYGHRAQQARDNDGVDWKAMSHAIRCGYQLREIYQTGDLKYPLAGREFLLRVKNGECDFLSEVEPALNAVVDEVEQLAGESAYAERVDADKVHEMVKGMM